MSYTCKMWWPASGTYNEASAKVTLKAFDRGNTKVKARNQSVVRTRAGNTLVYDRGINLNEEMLWQFRELPDVERANLISFLSAVSWGSSRIRVEDYRGQQYVVRITTPRIEYIDTGLMNFDCEGAILWDFDLAVVDLTDTDDAYGEDAIVPSPLYLHLSDYNHPHNPEVSIDLDIADGDKIVESLNARSYKAVIWFVVAEKDDQRYTVTVGAMHDGYGTTDATTTTAPTITPIGDTGGVDTKIDFSVDISGSGATQVMSLYASTTEDGFTIRARRFKL